MSNYRYQHYFMVFQYKSSQGVLRSGLGGTRALTFIPLCFNDGYIPISHSPIFQQLMPAEDSSHSIFTNVLFQKRNKQSVKPMTRLQQDCCHKNASTLTQCDNSVDKQLMIVRESKLCS